MNRHNKRRTFKPSPIKIVIEQPKATPMQKIWGVFKRILMSLGFLFLVVSILYSYLIISFLHEAKPELPEKIVLTHHFYGEIAEVPGNKGLDITGRSQIDLASLVEALNKAAGNENVLGFVARISPGNYSLAQLYDLKAAIKKFRGAGKYTYAYADSFGEAGYGMDEYFLAASFDEVWMQPLGSLSLNGFALSNLYFKGLFDKYKVMPEFFQREEFKSAMETFTRSGMSPESKAELEKVLSDISGYYLKQIADDRGVDPALVKQVVDQSPLMETNELAAKMIDIFGYTDQLIKAAEERFDVKRDDDSFITLSKFMASQQDALDIGNTGLADVMKTSAHKKKVAKIIMEGPIMAGSSKQKEYSPLSSNKVILSNDYAGAIIKAADDEDIKAILIRINSPGGSPVASETIRRAMIYAKQKDKPVILSMGTVAASGGYWIATAADTIFAAPSTLTGSIGVVSGKFVLGDALAEYGVQHDGVEFGKNADFLSPMESFDARGEAKMNEVLDYIYDSFLDRVAEGRGIDRDAVRSLAKGKVYSGVEAKKIGLIDEIGGLADAEEAVSVALAVSPRDIEYKVYPRSKTAVEQVLALMSGEWTFFPHAIRQAISDVFMRAELYSQSNAQLILEPQLNH
ncbi:MAG: signal peptide peptidase SppA [Micavibrio sp.]|nr:signal peptide peptidase SppA [Micavibrio sp.]HCK31983.1 signal peptide peptidase SppA [Rhodospirillaceae bacterium]